MKSFVHIQFFMLKFEHDEVHIHLKICAFNTFYIVLHMWHEGLVVSVIYICYIYYNAQVVSTYFKHYHLKL